DWIGWWHQHGCDADGVLSTPALPDIDLMGPVAVLPVPEQRVDEAVAARPARRVVDHDVAPPLGEGGPHPDAVPEDAVLVQVLDSGTRKSAGAIVHRRRDGEIVTGDHDVRITKLAGPPASVNLAPVGRDEDQHRDRDPVAPGQWQV